MLSRNNTSFALKLTEMLKHVINDEYQFLKYYQNIVRVYFTSENIDARGILLYFTMGMGKSITAIAVAMELMDKYKVILLLSKSLQENMTNAIKQYIQLRTKFDPDYSLGKLNSDDLDNYIKKKFTFVSLNASNMATQLANATQSSAFKSLDEKLEHLNKENLSGKLIIVDEAHNLFRSIRNGSKNATKFYQATIGAKNLRLLFMSGTPLGDPYDAAVCFNMLSNPSRQTLFPESYDDFTDYFVDPVTKMILHKNIFQNRIFGLVSYISHTSKILNNSIEFPIELPRKLEFAEMNNEQYTLYLIARNKEARENTFVKKSKASMAKAKSEFTSTYRVRSRQISNYVVPDALKNIPVEQLPPKFIRSPKLDKLMARLEEHKGRTGYVYSQFVGYSGLGIIKKRLELHGFTELVIDKKDLGEMSGITIESEPDEEPEVVPDDEKTGSSDEYDPHKDPYYSSTFSNFGAGLKFAIIKGGVDIKVRDRYRDIYNEYENRYGKNLSILLLSSTGAEGLDLKNTGHEHVFEVYWDENRIDQVVHRGIRNDSHTKMLPAEKQVQTYIYLSVPPKVEWNPTTKSIISGKYDITKIETTNTFQKMTKEQLENSDSTFKELVTTDLYLYINARKYGIGLKTFLNAIQEVSIECYLNGEENCRVCVPDDNRLFHDTLDEDIKGADPCRAYTPTKVVVKEILYDGIKYFYDINKESIFGYNIYKLDEQYGVYKKIPEVDELFRKIAEQLDAVLYEK